MKTKKTTTTTKRKSDGNCTVQKPCDTFWKGKRNENIRHVLESVLQKGRNGGEADVVERKRLEEGQNWWSAEKSCHILERGERDKVA